MTLWKFLYTFIIDIGLELVTTYSVLQILIPSPGGNGDLKVDTRFYSHLGIPNYGIFPSKHRKCVIAAKF